VENPEKKCLHGHAYKPSDMLEVARQVNRMIGEGWRVTYVRVLTGSADSCMPIDFEMEREIPDKPAPKPEMHDLVSIVEHHGIMHSDDPPPAEPLTPVTDAVRAVADKLEPPAEPLVVQFRGPRKAPDPPSEPPPKVKTTFDAILECGRDDEDGDFNKDEDPPTQRDWPI